MLKFLGPSPHISSVLSAFLASLLLNQRSRGERQHQQRQDG